MTLKSRSGRGVTEGARETWMLRLREGEKGDPLGFCLIPTLESRIPRLVYGLDSLTISCCTNPLTCSLSILCYLDGGRCESWWIRLGNHGLERQMCLAEECKHCTLDHVH